MAESQTQDQNTQADVREDAGRMDASHQQTGDETRDAERDVSEQVDALTGQVRDLGEEIGGSESDAPAHDSSVNSSVDQTVGEDDKTIQENTAATQTEPLSIDPVQPGAQTNDRPGVENIKASDETPPVTETTPETDDSTSPDAKHQSVEQLDATIAGDLDSLLEGEFESVDDVLDDVFETHGQFVSDGASVQTEADDESLDDAFDDALDEQPLDESLNDTAEPDAELNAEDVPDAPAAESHGEPPGPAAGAADTQEVDASNDTSQIDEPSVTAVDDDGSDETRPATESPEPAAADDSAAPETESTAPADEGAENDAPEPAAPVVETVDQPDQSARPESKAGTAAAQPEPLTTKVSHDTPAAQGAGHTAVLHQTVPVIKSALAIVNAPLNLLPNPVRAVVDWIALSLIFWVPIVWAIVLFVV